MADDLGVRDIEQLYSHCLIMYKGVPTYVHSVSGDRTLIVENLRTNKMDRVKFDAEDFKPLAQRLGYVNTAMGCAFLFRRPVRIFRIGISTENSNVQTLMTEYDGAIKQEILGLRSAAITHTLDNEFPSLMDAYTTAHNLNSAFAFDRQFAVDYHGRIIYRGSRKVGEVNHDDVNIDKIIWKDEFKYLSSLLDGSYGKNS